MTQKEEKREDKIQGQDFLYNMKIMEKQNHEKLRIKGKKEKNSIR